MFESPMPRWPEDATTTAAVAAPEVTGKFMEEWWSAQEGHGVAKTVENGGIRERIEGN